MANPMCPRCDRTRPMNKRGKAASGKPRFRCPENSGGCGYATTDPEAKNVRNQRGDTVQKGRYKPPRFARKLSGLQRFVVTSAQNATPIHEPFFKALRKYCEHNDAELIVVPFRYKNPTSVWTDSQENAEWWSPQLTAYLYNQRKKLNDNLILLGDLKIRPTMDYPLTGLEGFTHGESGIVGHSRLQLVSVPTPQGRLPKLMMTTGAITQRNYTDSKAGKKGEFHHVFGALAVDIVGKRFHVRQINAHDDGSFIDLENEYTPDGVYLAERALGLVMGDTHYRFIDPAVERATFGEDGIVDTLNPEYLVWHDLLDTYARNPHHRLDPFNEIAKRRAGLHDLRKEVEDTVSFLRSHSVSRKSIVVDSNHNDMFMRYIRDTDWRRDPDNAEFYLETARVMAASAKLTDNGASYVDPFAYWVEKLTNNDPNIRCLGPFENFQLGKIECGFHGDVGPNGTRGTIKNLSRIGTRVISGHGHSPGIEGGHYRVGTSTRLQLEYNDGPSSWLNSHCVVYANGKRSLIHIIDGEWRFA